MNRILPIIFSALLFKSTVALCQEEMSAEKFNQIKYQFNLCFIPAKARATGGVDLIFLRL
jgi:hypothetical protein